MPRSLTPELRSVGESLSPLPWRADPTDVFTGLAHLPGTVFIDSSDIDYGALSRWSFLSACPVSTLSFDRGKSSLSGRIGAAKAGLDGLEPFDALRYFLRSEVVDHEAEGGEGEPPFVSGAVGYIGYEMGRFIERLPARQAPFVDHPEMWFGHYPTVLAFRHADRSWWLGGSGKSEPNVDLASVLAEVAYTSANGDRLTRGEVHVCGPARIVPDGGRYLDAVRHILERIRLGDFYQANLTRQVELTLKRLDAVGLYLRLRDCNPAPFGMALKVGEVGPWILSSSPERFLRIQGRRIEACPIKGTAPRGDDERSDRANRASLLQSAKDAAELVMIVDVLRNDLGRVCEYGSVELKDHRSLGRFSRVYHLVSTVRGELRREVDLADVLRAAFPGGSITGAPKIKAMEALAELEPFGRGVYTGAMGYVDSGGSTDLNIAIRTMVAADDRVCFGVGGGIVADSDPEGERLETLHKARALFDALGTPTPDL